MQTLDVDELGDEELMSLAQDSMKALREVLLRDGSEFNQFVLKDNNNKPIVQSHMHRQWHRLVEKHKRLLIWSHVEGGKTTQLVIGRALLELARNPNLRIVIVSNTAEMATKSLRPIAHYIESDPELHLVAPGLIPSQSGDPWTSTQLFINRTSTSRDPSIQVCGVHGNILGSRIDLLIMDDVLDYENTKTPAARQDLYEWYTNTLVGRLTDEARVLIVGNAWHPEDLLHRLSREAIWTSFRFPVIDKKGNIMWPEAWPQKRIDDKRQELAEDPTAFARSMLCLARDDSEARFKEEWINLALRAGTGLKLVYEIPVVPKGCKTFTGVDLAVQKHESSGKTVLFSAMVRQDGRRQLLGIESGRWSGQEILDRMQQHHTRYKSVLIVENNAAQDFIRQFAGRRSLPVHPFTTGRNKAHPEYGVESLAAELAGGKWIFPCNEHTPGHFTYDPEISRLLTDMMYYDPMAHTGDHLMAMWFMREGARKFSRTKVQQGRLDLLSR